MRLVPTLQCRPGMKLGKAVLSNKGNTLLGYRVELTQSTIEKLYHLGYEHLFIDDPKTSDIVIEDPVREETKAFVRSQLRQIYSAFRHAKAIERFSAVTAQCQKMASMIIEDLDDHNNEMIMLMNLGLRGSDPEQIFIHNALNVSIYATKLGLIEHMPRAELTELCIGALLHDVGNAQIPADLLLKNAKLTPEEFTQIQKHTELGFRMLKDVTGIPLSSAHCALQHHEKVNGSGYPLNLKGHDIHPHAKWVGVVDAYDAMTNPRSYRKALLPHQALDILYACAGTLYDKEKVELFRNRVVVFPIGLSVQLSTGETGIVSKVLPAFKQRPTVRVLRDPSGEELRQPYEIDLSQKLNIMIGQITEDRNQGVVLKDNMN